MVVWDPDLAGGGVVPDALHHARIILWKGHCSVHTRFNVQQVDLVRRQHPDVRVIVHPECTWDVVQAADDVGSTEYIIRQITDSPVGSVWAVGTEIHLVSGLQKTLAPDRTVMTLDPIGARPCSGYRQTIYSGCSKGCSRVSCTIESLSPTARSAGPGWHSTGC